VYAVLHQYNKVVRVSSNSVDGVLFSSLSLIHIT
jgi:hypothetical protein